MGNPSPPTIAIVYDWATTGHGGAERVLSALHQTFPNSHLFTALSTSQSLRWGEQWPTHTSFLQTVQFLGPRKDVLAPLFPVAFETLDVSGFDIVISVTSSFAKGVQTSPQQLHVCYLLTPPRFLYSHSQDYAQSRALFQMPGMRQVYLKLLAYLRRWDRVASSRPDFIIPISNLVKKRAEQEYQRKIMTPIYPPVTIQPVDSPHVLRQVLPHQYLLVVSRLVAYKRVDLAIHASLGTQHQLVIVGSGPELTSLITAAGDRAVVRHTNETLQVFFARNQQSQTARVYFLGTCTDQEISWLYRHAHALLMPGIEDFGITGLEAALHGVPTILPPESGVAELLDLGVHAIYSRGQTEAALRAAIDHRDATSFAAPTLQKRAQQYDTETFIHTFRTAIMALWKEHRCQEL